MTHGTRSDYSWQMPWELLNIPKKGKRFFVHAVTAFLEGDLRRRRPRSLPLVLKVLGRLHCKVPVMARISGLPMELLLH